MISDFQLALIAIAAVFIAGVLLFNYIQERRYRQRAERAFKSDHPDVLFDAVDATRPARLEPSLGELPLPDNDVVVDDPESATGLAPRAGTTGVHAGIDSVALVLAEAPIPREALQPFMESARRFTRPVHWEGLVGGLWEPLSVADNAGEAIKELRIGMQLANRSGPTNKEQISEFMLLVEELAHAVSGVSQREEVDEAFQRAQFIDSFCADTDIEIAINVIGKNGATFAPTKVRSLAEGAGLHPLESGEYSQLDAAGYPLFTVRNMNPAEPRGIGQAGAYLSGLTLALDVPNVEDGGEAVDRMYAFALQLAAALGGEVVDDLRKPLMAGGVAAIRKAVGEITVQMSAFGVEPGSTAARRLYA